MSKSWKDRIQKSIKKLDNILSEATTSRPTGKPTLLKLAELYRKQNPQAWNRRQEEKERRDKLAIGQDEMSPFLQDYYEKLRKLSEEKRKKREWQKTQARKVKVTLQYSPTGIEIDPAEAKELDNSSVVSPHTDNALFGALKNIVGDDNKQGRGLPELMVTVVKGKYLNNGFDGEKERAEKCRAVVYMITPGESDPQTAKGYYRYVTYKGSTRWEYRFIFRGFTAQQLQKNYFIIDLVGKNADKKVNHGQAVISGPEALIKLPHGQTRKPLDKEFKPLESALKHPNTSDLLLFDLQHGACEVPDHSMFKLDLGIGSPSPTNSFRQKNKKGLLVKSLIKVGK